MEMLRDIKVDWWKKVIVKNRVLITRKLFTNGYDQVHHNM